MMLYREFLDAGYPIFGLHGVDEEGHCKCGNAECNALYKHPRNNGWQNTPIWDDEQLETMEESGSFKTGYGVLVEGLLVIDVDARNDGVESYAKLVNKIPLTAGCGLIIETGSGNGSKHLYFKIPAGLSLVQHVNDYPGIDFKTNGFVVGPGSIHASGKKYEVLIGSPSDIGDAPQELIDLLVRPDRIQIDDNNHVALGDINDLLEYISPDCGYTKWVAVGMAIHHSTMGSKEGLSLYDTWSKNSDKYNGFHEVQAKWWSFGKDENRADKVTYGTLVHYAEEGGYIQPIEFTSTLRIEDNDDFPLDISNINMLRPPGLVGDICMWINSRCPYPRERLAVAASLVAVGNVNAFRYTINGGTTSNLYAFCLAASATGKDFIMKAFSEIHREVGIVQAVYGEIKSEQELIRNFSENQATFYNIDEVGIFLKKVNNSGKSGASYYEALIGKLMNYYSKGDDYIQTSGDIKRDREREIESEIRSCIDEDRIKVLEQAKKDLAKGIKHPFISIIGYTTPQTFGGTVTHENVDNGFLGRALFAHEPDCNPKEKDNYVKTELPQHIKTRLLALRHGDRYDSDESNRVEQKGERKDIAFETGAKEMMRTVEKWAVEVFAENQKETTGMIAMVRRMRDQFARIALICGAPNGIVTKQDVLYAAALSFYDLKEKIRLVIAENDKKTNVGLEARILGLISSEKGETLAYIKNMCKTRTEKELIKCLDNLLKNNEIEEVKGKKYKGEHKILYKRK